MPIGGSAPTKTYTRSDGVRTGTAVNAQAKAALVNDTAALADFRENDLADAINSCVFRTGDNQPSAALPMNTYNHTGVGVATARDQYARASQVQDSSLIYGGTAGGTGDVITLDLTPSITAYAAGQMFLFKASATNTGAATANADSVGAVSIKKGPAGSTALAQGDITNGGLYIIMHDGTNFQLVGGLDAELKALAGLTSAADKLPYFDGAGTAAVADFTSFGRSLVDDANASAARTTLGLVISTDVQAYDADLTTLGAGGSGARDFLGLGTASNPQFATIELGAASDTTLARSGAGEITVEGNRIFRVGGADVPIADGGTGASTAANAFAALKQDATTAATGVVQMADQAAQEAGTTGRAVTSDVQHLHPSAAKFWGYVTVSAGTPTLQVNNNITSITDNGTGDLTITIATDFSSANWACLAFCRGPSAGDEAWPYEDSRAAGSVNLQTQGDTGSTVEPRAWSVAGFGDQ